MSEELETIKLDYKMLLNKSLTLYGASGSGKSAIIIDMLYHLSGHVSQILVYCPTDPSNRTYSNGVVPTPLIHYEFNIEQIEYIWARQEMMASVYAKANDMKVLESLYQKLQLSDVNRMLAKIRESKVDNIREIKDTYFDERMQKGKIAKIEEKYKELITLIYKKYINDYRSRLSNARLTEDEQHSLKYLNFNPRLVLVFDDCASDIKKYEKHPAVRKLFYQARHVHITLILACQDDKDIESSLRKNAFVSMFTTDACANAFFSRKANDFPRDMIKKVDKLCTALRWDKPYFEKLLYMRQENKLYKLVADLHDGFQFGSVTVREYCKSIERNGAAVDKNNPFYSDFLSS